MIKVDGVEIKQEHFPDNTLLMKFNPYNEINVSKSLIKVEWLYENDAELFALICVKRHLDGFFPGRLITLYMPYIPHARQDRVKSNEDVLTLKYFAEIINSLKFYRVYVRDAHSNVSLALIDNVFDMKVEDYINKAIKLSEADALFFPDEGAMKRYSEQSPMPYAFGMKKRDWETGKILGLNIINTENIVGKNILIVDDICSRGGTFYHSAKALKAAGAKSVSLYVTHCEKTIVLGEMASTDGLVDHVYTTKSIFPDYLFTEDYDPYWREWITVME